MKIAMGKRYLILPVSQYAARKKLIFRRAGRPVYDVECRITPYGKEYMYLDMREYRGMTLELEIEPGISYSPQMTDMPPERAESAFRPAVHFTAGRGWINDPNGLVYYEGLYHLFFQYNPADTVWGNMHWGHAVSRDLIHWEEKETALFPDSMGTMFSGCAVVDEKNLTGLQENAHLPLLLYYTAAGGTSQTSAGAPFTQCLAYSTDGGVTFRKYEKNPVLPHIRSSNRDPKLVYVEEEGCYYMVLYLSENDFAFFRTEDLLTFTQTQEYTLSGSSECPDLFPLYTARGEKYWILIGACGRYAVGRFVNGQYVTDGKVRRLHYGNGRLYAAQSYFGMPEGRRVRLCWITAPIPDSAFNGAMSLPEELTLREREGELLLCAEPAKEMACLYADRSAHAAQQVGAGETLTLPLIGKAQEIRLSYEAGTGGRMTLSLLGLPLVLDATANEICVREERLPLAVRDGRVTLRLITDTHALELYAGEGEVHGCVSHPADYSLPAVSLCAEKETALSCFEVRALSPVF